MSRRKSLADELVTLYNPAPTDHDPDDLELGDGARVTSDDYHEEPQRQPTRRAPEKGMLLRGDIILEDAVYRGRKTSRAAVFGDGGGAEHDSDENVDLDLGEDEDTGDAEQEEEEEDEQEDAAERRATASPAEPSGRTSAAAIGDGKRRKAQTAPAIRHEDDDEEAEEGVEDDGRTRTGAASGSDLDVASSGDEGEREELDGDAATGGRGAAAIAAGKRAGRRSGAGAGGGSELDELEAQLEALQEEDTRQLAELRQKSERDQVKGVAVRNQQMLYERALEQRIRLQKCLQASNGLPRPDTHAALVRLQPEVREGFSQLAASARSTLAQMLELQRTLMGRISGLTLPTAGPSPADAADGPSASGRSKRPRGVASASGSAENDSEGASVGEAVELLWQRLSSHHDYLAPYRDASLDTWHRRTVLSSGSGAYRNSGLRALNQSISSQVQALMRDPAKAIKRTRLTVAACPRVLGEPPRAGAASADLLDLDAQTDMAAVHTASSGARAVADPAAAAGGAGAGLAHGASSSVAAEMVEEERDTETYDDSEFYQQLLKEFLDKGLAQGAAAGAPKAAKRRKLVDRRASKGRKLRYHVQEKLVAFMAPAVDFEPPSFAANLFSNLFGHAGQ